MAAEIRDAFFARGEAAPSVKLAVEPASFNSNVDMALLNVDGQVIRIDRNGSGGGTLAWPGGAGSATLSLTPALPGRQSSISFSGPWALKRLIDRARISPEGEGLAARFVVGGRDVAFVMKAPSGPVPFSLPALSRFACPEGFE